MLNGTGIGIMIALILNIIAFILQRFLKDKVPDLSITVLYSVSVILFSLLAFGQQGDIIPNRY
jgi:hypothetical protein